MKSSFPERDLGLEGLRALSIFGVFLFHLFKPLFDVQPRTNDFVSIFELGKFGVQLFFLISGYVIASSLRRHNRFFLYARSRFMRLFPALLTIHLIILMHYLWFNNFEVTANALLEILFSVTLVDPNVINILTGSAFSWSTGVLWSLSVELVFYTIAGIGVYFFKVKSHYSVSLVITVLTIFHYLISFFSTSSLINELEAYLWGNYVLYLPWFALGSLYYEMRNPKKAPTVEVLLFGFLTCYLIFSMSQSVGYEGLLRQTILTLLPVGLLLLFSQSLKGASLRKLIQKSPLLFYGSISYEFYLIHEIMIYWLSDEFQLRSYKISNVEFANYFLIGIFSLLFSTSLALLLRLVSNRLRQRFIHTKR
jgi:hypothetical protein